jgi:transcriptional regulator with XRE-family HTH domain
MPQYYVLDGVAAARQAAGLSVQQLADKAGLTARKLSAIEAKAEGARRKLLLEIRHAVNTTTGSASFAAEPVLTKGIAAPGQTSTVKRLPKGIRVDGTKKGKRRVRPA